MRLFPVRGAEHPAPVAVALLPLDRPTRGVWRTARPQGPTASAVGDAAGALLGQQPGSTWISQAEPRVGAMGTVRDRRDGRVAVAAATAAVGAVELPPRSPPLACA